MEAGHLAALSSVLGSGPALPVWALCWTRRVATCVATREKIDSHREKRKSSRFVYIARFF